MKLITIKGFPLNIRWELIIFYHKYLAVVATYLFLSGSLSWAFFAKISK